MSDYTSTSAGFPAELFVVIGRRRSCENEASLSVGVCKIELVYYLLGHS